MRNNKVTQKNGSGYGYLIYVLFLTTALLMGTVFANNVMAQTRIVVLPFYTEQGRDAKEGGSQTLHYRRTMGFIENQLVRHGFEVIDPFAKDLSEEEYNRISERSREDSSLACKEMCKKYAVDVAYMIWLDVDIKRTADGYCKAKARLDGKGYDSGGRSIGANVSKTFKVTRKACDDAIAEVEKEVGDLVGRKLTAWSGNRKHAAVVPQSTGTQSGGGIVQREANATENLINIRLDGATEYELTEVFGKVINTARGVLEAKRYSSSLVPDNPQACFVVWRIRIEETDPFRLQANVMKMIDDVLDAGGEIMINGVPYRYTPAEVDLLKGIRPGESTSREIQFVVDRERARDREFSGRHDPYKAREKGGSQPGFD